MTSGKYKSVKNKKSMKKYIILPLSIIMALSVSARNKIYVSPNGGFDGTAWNKPCTFSEMVDSMYYSSNISGEVFVYFSEGEYNNVAIKLWYLPTRITNVHLIGGLKSERNMHNKLHQRDFIIHETVFHADSLNPYSIPVWLEYFSPHDTTKICSIDGITFTSDNHLMTNDALRLVGGNYVVTHCKFYNYKTTGRLMMLETYSDENVFIINTLIDNNVCNKMFGMHTKFHMINTTIADNTFNNFIDAIHHTAEVNNSIIWNNSALSLYYSDTTTMAVSHSYVQSQMLYMVDDNTNQWGVDPLFTYDLVVPYTCDDLSGIHQYGDASFFYQYSWAFEDYESHFDVAGNARFYDYGSFGIFSVTDAGAYQHYYESGASNYNTVIEPVRLRRRLNHTQIEQTEDALLWTNGDVVYVDMFTKLSAILSIYSMSGQTVYSTTLSGEQVSYNTYLQTGNYLAVIKSEDGETIIKKTIRLYRS